jgi:hypothetical protein
MEAKYQRPVIEDASEYDALIPTAKGEEIVVRNGGVKDTVDIMTDIINRYAYQTKKLSAKLAKDSGYTKTHDLNDLCHHVWDFVYNHIQYKLDEPGREQLRQPARAWADRFTGVDCDCYSLFIGTILTNLMVPFRLRVTKYHADWQHVYIVVDDFANRKQYIIDCVLDQYNEEKPYGPNGDFDPSGKFDTKIKPQMNGLGLPIAMLSGTAGGDDFTLSGEERELRDDPHGVLMGILAGEDFQGFEDLEGIGSADVPAFTRIAWENAHKEHLRKTRNYIAKHPWSVANNGGAKNHIGMIDYALDNWDKGEAARLEALDYLAGEEDRMAMEEIMGELEFDGMGSLGRKRKSGGFWKKIKEGLKKVGKVFNRFLNPLAIAARNGYLLALKLNFFGLARKIYPIFMTWEEAQKAGLSKAFWEKKQGAKAKLTKMWEEVAGGKVDKLITAARKGWNKKKHFTPKIKAKQGVSGVEDLYGLGLSGVGLGEPTSAIIGASVAAAATVIATVTSLLKKNGANDMPPEDPQYPEDGSTADKVASVANSVADATANITNAAQDSVDGLAGLIDRELYPELSGEEIGEVELEGLGSKADRQRRRAERKAKRQQKKAQRQGRRAAKKNERAQKKASRNSGDGGSVSDRISNAVDTVQSAGGAVSAANTLFKNATGKEIIPGLEQVVNNPEEVIGEEEAQKLIENDKKMKETMSEGGGMPMWGWGLIGAGVLGAGYAFTRPTPKAAPSKPNLGLGAPNSEKAEKRPSSKGKSKRKAKVLNLS